MLTSCNPFWAFHYAISIVHSVIQRVLPISTSPLPQISIYFALKPLTHPPSYAQLLTVGKYIQCQPGVLSAAREREADQPKYLSYALLGQLPFRSMSAYIPTGSMRPQIAHMSQLRSPWGELSRL